MNETTRIAKSVAQKRGIRCRYFNGTQHDKCEAGVCYNILQAGGLMLPCLPWHCDTGKPVAKCEKYGVYTAEEIAEQEREIERSITGIITARKAIVAELDRRHAAGDKSVTAKPHHDDEFSETGCQSAYVAGAGTIPCPSAKPDRLDIHGPRATGTSTQRVQHPIACDGWNKNAARNRLTACMRLVARNH